MARVEWEDPVVCSSRFHLFNHELAVIWAFIGAKMMLVDVFKIPVSLTATGGGGGDGHIGRDHAQEWENGPQLLSNPSGRDKKVECGSTTSPTTLTEHHPMQAPAVFRFPDCFDEVGFDHGRLGCLVLSVTGHHQLPRGCARIWANVVRADGVADDDAVLGVGFAERALRLFQRDRASADAMAATLGGCRVFTHAWDDEALSFRYFWVELPEAQWLQVLCVFEPAYAAFFKRQIMMAFFDTALDAHALVASAKTPASAAAMFALEPAAMDAGLIKAAWLSAEAFHAARQASAPLDVGDEAFAERALKALKEKGEVLIGGMCCRDWATHYTYGAHNFSNPDSEIKWEDNDGLLRVHEPPWSTSEVVEVTALHGDAEVVDVTWLPHLTEYADAIERNLLKVLEQFVFGEGAGYAEPVCFEWVKLEAERQLGQPMTREAFFKRNVAVGDIQLLPGAPKADNSIRMWLRCSWDEEHGMAVRIDACGQCWRDEDV